MRKFKILGLLASLLAITAISLDTHARSRYYHPTLGRFMQRDVLGHVDGMSLYQYAGSNPVVRTDPTGGCSSADKAEVLKCKCFCVRELTIHVPNSPSP